MFHPMCSVNGKLKLLHAKIPPAKPPREWWIGFTGPGNTQLVLTEHPGELAVHFKEIVHVKEVPL